MGCQRIRSAGHVVETLDGTVCLGCGRLVGKQLIKDITVEAHQLEEESACTAVS